MMLVEVKRISKTEMTVVSSLDVAETFEKNHRDVMESIRNIETNISRAEFSALFYLDSYKRACRLWMGVRQNKGVHTAA